MSTLLRLFKHTRRYHANTGAPLAKSKFENPAATDAFSTSNRHHNNMVQSSTQPSEPASSSIDWKMEQINKEIQRIGRISKFHVEDIVEDMKKFGNVTSLQGLFLLRSCSEMIDNKTSRLRRKLGEDIWKTLKDLGVRLDVSHYNALLTIYLETDYEFSTMEFLDNMLESNVKPNRVTFQRLMWNLCSKGKMLEAKQIFEHMKVDEIPANENMFSSLIYGYCLNSDTEAVVRTMEEMKSLDIQPTMDTYSSFLYAYAQKGDIENIRMTLKNCEDYWIPCKVLLNVIYHLSVNGFDEYVDEILELMPKSTQYEKEAIKIIYKLVEKQKDETAFKVYLSLPRKKKKQGTFFIQTLVNLDIPVEKSIEYCRLMEEMGINQYAFVSAIRRSIANDMYESTYTLMKAWNDLGGEIKEYFFCPILKAYSQTNDVESILKVLQKMILEFKIEPSMKFLSTFILPHVVKNADEALSVLMDLPINHAVISNAVLMYLITKNDLQEAVKFISLNSSHYGRYDIKEPLIKAFKKTGDVPSFVRILHYLYIKALNESGKSNIISIDFLDSCVIDVIDFLAQNKYLNLMFFRNLHEQGLSISAETVDKVRKVLGKDLPKRIYNILDDLKSGELIPKPIEKGVHAEMFTVRRSMNIEKLENLNLLNIDPTSVAASSLRMRTLIFYCCSMNEEKVNELVEDFRRYDQHFTESNYAMLIHMYVALDKIDQAERWLDEANTNFPNFRINKISNLRLINALVERGDIEKALDQIPRYKHSVVHTYSTIILLNTVAALDDEEMLHRFFDQLYIHGYIIKMYPGIMAPFMRLYIARNDGKAGYKKCKWLYNAYGQAPYPMELMKNLIKNGDSETLDDLTLFYAQNFSVSKSYFYLAIAYLENDELAIAKEVITKHCLDLSEKLVLYFAEGYYNKDQGEKLEKLFRILCEADFDVECLCILLLKSYSLQGEWNKCYNLWNEMLKNNIKLPPSFFNYLDEMLKNPDTQNLTSLKEFHQATQKYDLLRARQMLDCMPTIHKSDCYSSLCQKYVSCGSHFSEALDLWRDLRERYNKDISQMAAEYILGKLLHIKDVRSIDKVGLYMSSALKNKLDYSYYLNKAYLSSGSWNLYLKQLENQLNKKIRGPKDLNMHYRTALEALLRYPALYDQFEALAYKYSKSNIKDLLYVLWAYNFLEKNPKADDLWIHVTAPKLFFELNIMSFLQYHNDLSLYVRLAEFVHRSHFNDHVKLRIYSSMIESCMESGNPNKYLYSLKCLQQGVEDVPMQSFNMDLLVELQKGLEASGTPWPWSNKKQNEMS